MKKISMIVVFCMVLGLLFSSVAAQEPVKLILSDVTGDIGGRVTVSVAVGSDVELGGFQLLINYDPNFLEYIGCSSDMKRVDPVEEELKNVGVFQPNPDYSEEPGILAIAWADSENVKKLAGESLFRIAFNIKEGTQLESAIVAIDLDDEYNKLSDAEKGTDYQLEAGVVQGTVSLPVTPDPVTPDPVTPDPVTPKQPTDTGTKTDDAKTKKGSQMLPFMLLGGLLTLVGATMILPFRKLRRQ